MNFGQIAFCTAGTLNTTPTNVIAMGITSNEELKTSRLRGIKIEHRDQELPNYDNLLLTASTPQCSLLKYMTLLGYMNGNCDIQIITGEGKVYKFTKLNSPLGIKPKLEYSKDSRLLSVEIEGAFPKVVWDSILAAAVSATAHDLSLSPLNGADYDATREVYPLAIASPISTGITGPFTERKITLECKEKTKDINNISLVSKILATINFVKESVTLADYIDQRSKGVSPSFLWKEGNGATIYDGFIFDEGVLVQDAELDETGDKTELNVTYKGSFPVAKMTANYSTGTGGGQSADGSEGGTLTITY
jgi:hypothetical protein